MRSGLLGGIDRLIRRDRGNNHVCGGRECCREFDQNRPGFLRTLLNLFAQAGRVHVDVEGNGALHTGCAEALGQVESRLAEAHESETGDPQFRPRFKHSYKVPRVTGKALGVIRR